jgi:heterodisulfide reductase subunit C
MDTVMLNRPDTTFVRAVEDESGQVVSRCYQCGNCTAGCPMSFSFDYPVSRIMRLIQAGQKESVLSSKAIWLCATCETCTQRCPNEIDVARVMDVCRHMARREKAGAAHAVKAFFDSFVNTVSRFGRSHEIGVMALFMLRTGRFWTDVDLAPKVLPKGKMPIKPHCIEGHKDVGAIFRRFREGAADVERVRAGLLAKGADAGKAALLMTGAEAVDSPPAPDKTEARS